MAGERAAADDEAFTATENALIAILLKPEQAQRRVRRLKTLRQAGYVATALTPGVLIASRLFSMNERHHWFSSDGYYAVSGIVVLALMALIIGVIYLRNVLAQEVALGDLVQLHAGGARHRLLARDADGLYRMAVRNCLARNRIFLVSTWIVVFSSLVPAVMFFSVHLSNPDSWAGWCVLGIWLLILVTLAFVSRQWRSGARIRLARKIVKAHLQALEAQGEYAYVRLWLDGTLLASEYFLKRTKVDAARRL